MKEEDIRPANLHEEYLKLSKADAMNFFSANQKRDIIPCPACNSNEAATGFEKDGFGFVSCAKCGTLYQSPRPELSAFEKFYVNSPSSNYWAEVFFPAIAESRRKLIFQPRVKQIGEYCDKNKIAHNTVIDVGAGFGIFLEEWRNQNPKDKICAIEPGEKLANSCRDRGFETLETTSENSREWFGKGDLITCFEVIEHVYSPLEFIVSLKKLTRPGGYVMISGLGVDGYDIQILWEKSKSISPPHHINFMSIEGFEILFKRAGFENIDILTPGKLDAEIVSKSIQQEMLENSNYRFASSIKKRGQNVQEDFQNFLVKHKLSSHVWVFAKNPG
jgi:Zn ribbon nucleic-acid-binding protein